MKYNVICDRCGARYKAQELIKESQTGYMVCRFCLDPRRQINMAPHPYRAQIPWSSPPLALDVSLPVTSFLNPGSLQLQSGLLTPTLIGNLSPGSVSITGTDLNDFRGDGRFLAIHDIGDGNAFSSDNDGETWATITLSSSIQCQAVAFGADTFVIVGLSRTAMISPTGDSGDWSNVTLPDLAGLGFTNQWWRVRWHPGADGTTGGLGDGCFSATGWDGGIVALSPTGADGTWTLMVTNMTPGDNTAKGQLAFSPTLGSGMGRWVYVCRGVGGFGNSQSRYSDDGMATWTLGSGLHLGSNWDDVIWSSRLERFVTGVNNTNFTAYSADGITFTEDTASNGQVFHLIENDTTIASSAIAGANAFSTVNGVGWSSHATGAHTDMQQIAWNGSVFGMGAYATGDTLKNLITSPDLVTWTEYTNNVPTTNMIGLIARWL